MTPRTKQKSTIVNSGAFIVPETATLNKTEVRAMYLKCNDDRLCMFQDTKTGKCKILRNTYEKSGECPFCKGTLKETGNRERINVPIINEAISNDNS